VAALFLYKGPITRFTDEAPGREGAGNGLEIGSGIRYAPPEMTACFLCGAMSYYCGAAALAPLLPSLGVSSLDLGRTPTRRGLFLVVRQV
jgi:hypothetical protein